eukprot:TRINITY_DN3546_c0_g1_i3.p1 TRINITY_DN3546_c0_g1~~TRINITY_DN3546_c0_g1_i3.p1  ORF type:complete len:482 (-),score=115.63 TRINITY_DN3546_c0_g1_i3:462-1907(-)
MSIPTNIVHTGQLHNQVVGIQLRCTGKKIEMVDGLLGKSDPFIEIHQWDGTGPVGPLVWRTEAIQDTRSPVWEPFPIFYDLFNGNMKAQVIVQIFDYESDGDHTFIGSFTTPIEDLIEGREFVFINKKKKKNIGYKNSGKFVVEGSTLITNANEHQGTGYLTALRYELTFEAQNLDPKDVLGKSDPFLVISAIGEGPDGVPLEPKVVARTEIIMDKTNPVWNSIWIEGVSCHPLTKLKLDVYDYDEDLRNDLIGTTYSNLHELRMGHILRPLINPKKKNNIGYRNSGTLIVRDFHVNNEQRANAVSFNVALSARRLMSRDLFGKSDPYITISATPLPYVSYPYHPNLNFIPLPEMLPAEERPKPAIIYRSEVIKDDHEPTWHEFELSVADCGGLTGNLLIQVWDYDRLTSPEIIGQVTTTLTEMQTPAIEYRLKSPKKNHHGTQGILAVREMVPSPNEPITGFHPAYSYSVKIHGAKSFLS